ncbi:hypothetical protein CFB82_20045 [Burkholderia sp. HI2714]|uniref:phage tail fiber domain-containing protein n=1 Tax=Burkholderia sp. HI2714 TaxID=2015359 RepID=UPI000B7AADA0|nr:phage tail fiber protein [Burkholderia sp. HI2714]OXJ32678.1 hypothetical protein CFB82_20045 [Burkholderia sp. HI2714]
MTFPQTYQTDGSTTVWSFDFPYLDRSNVFVVVNNAARAFTFVDDHTIRCADSFGNPFPPGQKLTISRATPDLISLAEFKDAAKLTADDLNRARLQCLLLIQERSGGMAGSVGNVISGMVNEIETISGALDSLSHAQGVLEAGLGTLRDISVRLTIQENGAAALRDQITQEVQARQVDLTKITDRLSELDVNLAGQQDAFRARVQLLESSGAITDSQVSGLSARVGNIEANGDNNSRDAEDAALASLVNGSVAAAKQGYALAQQITSLAVEVRSNNTDLKAQIQVNQSAQADTNSALAAQITTLSAEVEKSDAAYKAALKEQQATSASADEALATKIESLSAEIAANDADIKAQIQANQTAQATVNEATAQKISNLSAEVDANDTAIKAQLKDQQIAQSGVNSAVAQQISELTAEVDANDAAMKAALKTERDTRTTAEQALAAQYTDMSARIGERDGDAEAAAASLINSAIASVKADSVLTQQITTLSAAVVANDTAIKAQLQVEQTTRADAVSALAQQITSLQAQVGNDITAQIREEQKTRAAADQSLADQLTVIQSEMGENFAQVAQEMHTQIDKVNGTVANLQAQYTLKAQVKRPDGTPVVSGIGLAATASDDYTGSVIALMADSVVFADPNNPNGALVPFLEAGMVDGAPTLVVPSARVGDKVLPGRVLVDGAVEARSIKVNSVTGDRLVAGSISTDKLQVGLGVNLLKNSTLVNLVGWGTWSNGGGTGVLGLDNGAEWTLAGGHTMYVRSTGAWGNTDPNAVLFGVFTEKVPVVGGSFYEYSAYVGVHRCAANIGIEWYDSNGAAISSNGYGAAGTATTVGQAAGGKTLNGYVRIGGIAQAPVNAALGLIGLRKGMNVSPDTDSWLFVTQPMMAETHASATRLSPYKPSGLGTLITPEGISTPSLSALSANIGLLRTATWGARTEISNNLIQTFDGNNVLRIRLGVW